jgi:hypothetical protein
MTGERERGGEGRQAQAPSTDLRLSSPTLPNPAACGLRLRCAHRVLCAQDSTVRREPEQPDLELCPCFFDGRRRRRRIRDVLRWALAAPCWARCWRSVAPRRQAATMELGRVRPISDATNGPEVPVAVATSRWTRSGARQRCTCASCACYVCHTPLQPRTLFFISQQHPHSRSAEGAKRTLHRPTHTRKMVCRQL